VLELLGRWWADQAPVTLGLTVIWLALIILARKVAAQELPRLRQSLWLLLAHAVVGLLAAAPAHIAPSSGDHQLPLLAARLLSVAIGAGLFNHLVLGIGLGRFQRSVPTLLRDALTLAALVVASIILLARHGFDVKALLPTGAVLTAVIGLALQQTLGNLVGGLSLQLDKSVRVGDWVSVDGLFGRVSAIRWRYTALETNNYETIIVPNSQLLGAKLLVRGRRDGAEAPWRRWINFNLPLSAPAAEIIALAESCLDDERPEHVAAHPRPNAVLLSLEDGVAKYALRYWLNDFLYDDQTDSAVRLRLLYALRRAGYEPALPAQQVTLRQDDAKARVRAENEEYRSREETLRSMALFRGLTDNEIARLARELKPIPFAPGEALCRQGEEAHSLYIIKRGRVIVQVSGEGGAREVARLKEGDYFGEMALMTGEPRTATVLAESHVDALRLDKPAFHRLLTERPELAEQVAAALAARRAELEQAREQLDHAARTQREREHHGQLLLRIRAFFGGHK
jgi:small-conductance mechanosensitive channel/CRP-like cAMP-binding protein